MTQLGPFRSSATTTHQASFSSLQTAVWSLGTVCAGKQGRLTSLPRRGKSATLWALSSGEKPFPGPNQPLFQTTKAVKPICQLSHRP